MYFQCFRQKREIKEVAQATRKINSQPSPMHPHVLRSLREGALLVFGAIAVYLLLSLASYQHTDPGWSHTGSGSSVANAGGMAGAWFADIFLYIFGYTAYLFPFMVGFSGWMLYRVRGNQAAFDWPHFGIKSAGFVITVCSGAALASLHFITPESALPYNAGGILGDSLASMLASAFSFLGATLFLLALFLTGFTLFTGLSWLWLMDETGRATLDLTDYLKRQSFVLLEWIQKQRAKHERKVFVKTEQTKVANRQAPRIEPVVKKIEPSKRATKDRQVPLFDVTTNTDLPSLSLLDPAESSGHELSNAALEAMSRQVEIKLADFGVEAEVVAVLPGPVVTLFEIQPAPGVKVSRITNLSKDLARALSVISVRVVEVIPGKSVIGLEVPNEYREMVRLGELIESKEYEDAGAPTTLALGKDISGGPVVADLARMPHLLVAGTTGSGKSVAVNAMILSILYSATPKEVRMIMIDPKMLELSVYEGIPHLLTPVVTDVRESANALRWCVGEMERRYKLMAALGVRNIGGYNRKVEKAIEAGEPLTDPTFESEFGDEAPELQTLPSIVVIVDELADMMMIVGKKVEQLIARLAQKARASGIHLILATQRPSVDVITGLIKANIPSRIAFQVSSRVDSRTIIDQMGADQLLGHGDMLYLPSGTNIPMRVHGAFVADEEVHKVVADLRKRSEPDYLPEILEGASEDGGNNISIPGMMNDDDEADPLYDDAVRIVTESRRASVSGIQRRLKIGYNRAARMVEQMERSGVVSEMQANGSREVIAPPPPK